MKRERFAHTQTGRVRNKHGDVGRQSGGCSSGSVEGYTSDGVT